MKIIRINDKGNDVKKWQNFLFGIGYTNVIADGDFGKKTEAATKNFQKNQGLKPDGVVGNHTYAKAMLLNFELIKDSSDTTKQGLNWPPPPNFKWLTNVQLQAKFGKIEYVVNNDGRTVTITNNWKSENLKVITIPQLANKPPYNRKTFNFHKDVVEQVQKLFNDWEKAGLVHLILTFDGDFNPRLIKASKNLSTHSFGISFDINAKWNGLGITPALVGEEGSVRELVSIANKNGFYWGGHFSRKDGMHFELAKSIS